MANSHTLGTCFSPAMRERVRERFEALKPPPGEPFIRPMRVNLLQKT